MKKGVSSEVLENICVGIPEKCGRILGKIIGIAKTVGPEN